MGFSIKRGLKKDRNLHLLKNGTLKKRIGVRVLGTLTGIALLEARFGEGLCIPRISLRR